MLTPQLILNVLPAGTQHIYIGFSGGKDSHVLLHLLSSIPEIKSKITAVYVHHGLQAQADEWEQHCRTIATDSKVFFQCFRVNVSKKNRQSQEELARNARYQTFKSLLAEHDILLLAQHREDQLETVLLQLFRGAGVKGLSGMPVSAVWGAGHIIRPLLHISQTSIHTYAQHHHLRWITDPSNNDNDFDRNFLRNKIVPQLKQRWAALDKTIPRSARHCADSHFLNNILCTQLLHNIYDKNDNSLDIRQLLRLNKQQQHLIIRQWFHSMQLRMPSEKTVLTIVAEMLNAKPSVNPKIKHKTYCIRRYRHKLYGFKNDPMDLIETEKRWQKGCQQLHLNGSILTLCRASEGVSQSLWRTSEVRVKFRTGSEKIKLVGRQGHHSLKKLFQEKAIAPWERATIPLIYLNDELVAIADLWMSADFCDTNNDCWQFHWAKNKNAYHNI